MEKRTVLAVDTAFYITVISKGIGGFIEMTSGILLALASTATVERVLSPLSHLGVHEVANISQGTKLFVVLYFSLRGLLRIVLAISLLREQLWAYPVTLAFLGLSTLYQTWLMASGHFSVGLLGLTMLDLVIVALTAVEYRKLRHGGHLQRPHL